jgi:hypothetical protein
VSQQLVTVEGTYLDKKGNPIVDAHVMYERDGVVIGDDYTDGNGAFSMQVLLTEVEEPSAPANDALTQNKPNPFLGETRFTVTVEDEGDRNIYDLSGRLVSSMEL